MKARCLFAWCAAGVLLASSRAEEPPVINPFARRAPIRDDAVPGYVQLSNGKLMAGHIHLTRDTRLKIYDEGVQRQREVPLKRIRQLECSVVKQWMEKEWRFAENASDRKLYTGRSYPARIYAHTITLTDGRKIHGPLSGIVYLQREGQQAQKFVLHKRDKGRVGYDLDSLVYVRLIRLGPDALTEGKAKESQVREGRESTSPKKGRTQRRGSGKQRGGP
jgi:hypothetical protein